MLTGKDQDERIGTLEPGKTGLRRRHGIKPLLQVVGDQMGDNLGIGFGVEAVLLLLQFRLQFLIILDDAVMDDGHTVGRVRVGIVLGRRAMGCPTGMADADIALERVGIQLASQIDDLARSAATLDMTIGKGRDPGTVIAAILETAEALKHGWRNIALPQNTDNTAHGF